VDTAMRLTERDLRTMEKLVAAQSRLAMRNVSAGVAPAVPSEQIEYAGVA